MEGDDVGVADAPSFSPASNALDFAKSRIGVFGGSRRASARPSRVASFARSSSARFSVSRRGFSERAALSERRVFFFFFFAAAAAFLAAVFLFRLATLFN